MDKKKRIHCIFNNHEHQLNNSAKTLRSAAKCGFEILLHLSYSPDLAPSVCYLFPKMKYDLRRKGIDSIECNNAVMVGLQT